MFTKPAITTLVLAALAAVASGCGGESGVESTQSGNGPRIVASIPGPGGLLEGAKRTVSLEFDRELDSGARVGVELDGTDVVAKAPALSVDRRKVDTTIDVEGTGMYHVTWSACSAKVKTECSEGTFGFRAEGRTDE